jgi:hypothetical protein
MLPLDSYIENLVILFTYFPLNVNALCNTPPPPTNNCKFFVPATLAHKHKFSSIFSIITQSNTWGSVSRRTILNTQKCAVQRNEPQKRVHPFLSVSSALSPERTNGIKVALAFTVLFPVHLRTCLPLEGQEHKQAVSWTASGLFHFICFPYYKIIDDK